MATEIDPPAGYAFRCRNCNSLEEGAAAGDNAVPHACRICGAGVHWEIVDGKPVLRFDPDNWVVLADLPTHELSKVLKYHALGEDEIVRYTPGATSDPLADPQHLSVDAVERTSGEDVVS